MQVRLLWWHGLCAGLMSHALLAHGTCCWTLTPNGCMTQMHEQVEGRAMVRRRLLANQMNPSRV